MKNTAVPAGSTGSGREGVQRRAGAVGQQLGRIRRSGATSPPAVKSERGRRRAAASAARRMYSPEPRDDWCGVSTMPTTRSTPAATSSAMPSSMVGETYLAPYRTTNRPGDRRPRVRRPTRPPGPACARSAARSRRWPRTARPARRGARGSGDAPGGWWCRRARYPRASAGVPWAMTSTPTRPAGHGVDAACGCAGAPRSRLGPHAGPALGVDQRRRPARGWPGPSRGGRRVPG